MSKITNQTDKYKIAVYGMVQGIGYRPYVKRLALKMGIVGTVMNSGGIVVIFAYGEEKKIQEFADELKDNIPFGARIDQVTIEKASYNGESVISGFNIIPSQKLEDKMPPLIPVDLPTCPQCEKELLNHANRRYQYPFISCVHCGPRYSIIESLPYDRENTTMTVFEMCKNCQEEYTNVENLQRCHAQTISCHDCGPQLKGYYRNNENFESDNDILEIAVEYLVQGKIVAVKDIGGYHLACLANNKEAVDKLRKVKNREKKPFAVMFSDVLSIKQYANVNTLEERELNSLPRPIVLLGKKKEFIGDVCKNSYEIGCMLPCNPLQILLLRKINEKLPGEALVMTSANRSGEPIIISNSDMRAWYLQEEDIELVLEHDRDIITPLDDSVIHVIGEKVQVIRRSRGFVPEPVFIGDHQTEKQDITIYAAGGDLKSTFCFCKGNRAYLSQYLGDLESDKIEKLYINTYYRMRQLFKFKPDVGITDMHPMYHSAMLAQQLVPEITMQKVQHHFAHVASVLAEHFREIQYKNEKGLAFVFDGTGYGLDGTVWGGEFIYISGSKMERIGHIQPVQLAGGNEGAKNARTIMYGYLLNAYNNEEQQIQKYIHEDEYEKLHIIHQALKYKVNTVTSTSMGRLFDAVSALFNISNYNHYEGQSAMELETVAEGGRKDETNAEGGREDSTNVRMNPSVPVYWKDNVLIADTVMYFRKLAEETLQNNQLIVNEKAFSFHLAIVTMVAEAVQKVKERKAVDYIVLSGGTFQNRLLLENITEVLEEQGIKVYINEKVPSGDGGISLGQAFIAKENIQCV